MNKKKKMKNGDEKIFSYCADDINPVEKNCCDFDSGRIRAIQMRELENGKFQIRENEHAEWQDCEIEIDELGNPSLSFTIKAIPLL